MRRWRRRSWTRTPTWGAQSTRNTNITSNASRTEPTPTTGEPNKEGIFVHLVIPVVALTPRATGELNKENRGDFFSLSYSYCCIGAGFSAMMSKWSRVLARMYSLDASSVPRHRLVEYIFYILPLLYVVSDAHANLD
jgi:hypothetical protein